MILFTTVTTSLFRLYEHYIFLTKMFLTGLVAFTNICDEVSKKTLVHFKNILSSIDFHYLLFLPKFPTLFQISPSTVDGTIPVPLWSTIDYWSWWWLISIIIINNVYQVSLPDGPQSSDCYHRTEIKVLFETISQCSGAEFVLSPEQKILK